LTDSIYIYGNSLEKNMKPSSEATALEGKGGHQEYIAAGKLKGNKALITGGEYARTRSPAHSSSNLF
jgi:hypothetical protein